MNLSLSLTETPHAGSGEMFSDCDYNLRCWCDSGVYRCLCVAVWVEHIERVVWGITRMWHGDGLIGVGSPDVKDDHGGSVLSGRVADFIPECAVSVRDQGDPRAGSVGNSETRVGVAGVTLARRRRRGEQALGVALGRMLSVVTALALLGAQLRCVRVHVCDADEGRVPLLLLRREVQARRAHRAQRHEPHGQREAAARLRYRAPHSPCSVRCRGASASVSNAGPCYALVRRIPNGALIPTYCSLHLTVTSTVCMCVFGAYVTDFNKQLNEFFCSLSHDAPTFRHINTTVVFSNLDASQTDSTILNSTGALWESLITHSAL